MTGEQPELWGTQKRDRLATLLRQIVEMDDRLQSGELTSGQEVQVPGFVAQSGPSNGQGDGPATHPYRHRIA
jgi:hypothetical protein